MPYLLLLLLQVRIFHSLLNRRCLSFPTSFTSLTHLTIPQTIYAWFEEKFGDENH